jgi:hypothetical protein
LILKIYKQIGNAGQYDPAPYFHMQFPMIKFAFLGVKARARAAMQMKVGSRFEDVPTIGRIQSRRVVPS